MLDEITCVKCGESEMVQIGTEQIFEKLCYICYDEKDSDQ
jgi:NMD protein affecting ribosome stability and mRNA decay